MNFTLAAHQPNFLPWLGYFAKWALSDSFIHMDDVLFSRGSVINRVRTEDDKSWLTMPVHHAGKQRSIRETRVVTSGPQTAKLLRRLSQAALACRFRKDTNEIVELLESLLLNEENLGAINMAVNDHIASELEIKASATRGSAISQTQVLEPNERLAAYCRLQAATVYLSGPGAGSYLRNTVFQREGILVDFIDYEQLRATRPIPVLRSIFDEVAHFGYARLADELAEYRRSWTLQRNQVPGLPS